MDPLLTDIVVLLRAKRPAHGTSAAGLAAALNIPVARLNRALDEIRELGYVLQVESSEAIRLVSSPDRMIDTEILSGLKTKLFARQLHCYRKIGSTNTRATQLAESGAPEGTVVVAEEQTGGRGRLGRSWHSAPGLGIWSSVILRPQMPLQRASGLSLLAALAFAEVAEERLGLRVDLKWPNDGLIDGKKILGVLTEVSAEVDRVYHAVCGTGINVSHQPHDFPPSLRPAAGSLAMAAGEPVDRIAFYRAFLERFETLYRRFRRGGIAPFLPDYRRRSILLGKDVTIRQGEQTISGVATGIDDNGALIIRSGKREVVISSGEATLSTS
ncbi:MAG: biotin--[acetyl-CoA-carboxylase] ligase [candidate division Zixibacteria bacterium]|nr:biotin--[acetyl-CoA-carboxylase] ligase [candidate division Zixibacteria bacterium]